MSYLCLHDLSFWRQYNIWFIHNNNTFVNNTLNVVNATYFLELFPRSKWDGLVICDCTCDVPLSSIRKVLLHAIINQPSMSFFIFFKYGNSFSQDSKYIFLLQLIFIFCCNVFFNGRNKLLSQNSILKIHTSTITFNTNIVIF